VSYMPQKTDDAAITYCEKVNPFAFKDLSTGAHLRALPPEHSHFVACRNKLPRLKNQEVLHFGNTGKKFGRPIFASKRAGIRQSL
jgi:hypothetical protein